MSQSWSDFPVIDSAPDPSSCQQLADNTWSLLVMWAAGPEWIVATPDRTVREPVVRVTDCGDGEFEYKTIPFSASHQQEEDDHLDAQLALLELPPRPRGFD